MSGAYKYRPQYTQNQIGVAVAANGVVKKKPKPKKKGGKT